MCSILLEVIAIIGSTSKDNRSGISSDCVAVNDVDSVEVIDTETDGPDEKKACGTRGEFESATAFAPTCQFLFNSCGGSQSASFSSKMVSLSFISLRLERASRTGTIIIAV